MKILPDLRILGTLGVVLILALLAFLWPRQGEALHAAGPGRSLAEYRVHRMPKDLPQVWRDELANRLENSPEVSLLDPRAGDRVRELLSRVSWVDPASLEVVVDAPEGIQVHFRNRIPRFRLVRQGRRLGIASQLGVVLPEGIPEDLARGLFAVELDPGSPVPAPGRACADPVLQEAGRALPELLALYHGLQLNLTGVRRRTGALPGEASLPAPLAFEFHDGGILNYGYAASTRAPGEPDPRVKYRRLARLLELFPELRGLSRIDLDLPRVRVWDEAGEEVALPPI